MQALPIDAVIPRICEHLRRPGNLLVQAPPGAGKTTRVPPALLQMVPGEIWVLESLGAGRHLDGARHVLLHRLGRPVESR